MALLFALLSFLQQVKAVMSVGFFTFFFIILLTDVGINMCTIKKMATAPYFKHLSFINKYLTYLAIHMYSVQVIWFLLQLNGDNCCHLQRHVSYPNSCECQSTEQP